MDFDLGLGYLDLTFFSIATLDVGFTVPWWAIGLGALAAIFFLTRLIQAAVRD
ncbi:hypothetical protein ACQP2T_61895 [Nonomuraea sp. CA-143628]|uniref:hypothetical protein n=1 Tax=Nonomuraea sp. CA-143628 TaxID=3239997 RepID=UPI003D8D0C1B